MSTAPKLTVTYEVVWVVLKVQGGEKARKGENESLARRGREGNTAVGILLLLLAWVIYPSNIPIALGAALLGVYLIFGGR